ncbi:hypothetical protein [Parafannyhessea sp. LCP21S3_E6]
MLLLVWASSVITTIAHGGAGVARARQIAMFPTGGARPTPATDARGQLA